MARVLEFPNPVNEAAARVVASGVAVLALATLVLSLSRGSGWLWLAVPLAYGFLARVLAGPTVSPLGQFATRVAAPRLGVPKLVAGPPKRFAQGIGALLTTAVVVLHFGFAADGAAQILIAALLCAATLEAVFAYCVGCVVFGALMRVGLVPEQTCLACADVRLRDLQRARVA